MLNLSLPLLVIALLTKLIASTPCNQLANFCPLKDRLNQDLLTDGTTSTVASASGSSCAYKADSGNNVCVYSNPTSTTDADTCTLTLTSGTAACPSHIGDAPPNECPFTNKDALLLIGFEPVLGSQLCTYLAGVEADSFQPCNYLQATGKLIGGPDACPDALGGPPPSPRPTGTPSATSTPLQPTTATTSTFCGFQPVDGEPGLPVQLCPGGRGLSHLETGIKPSDGRGASAGPTALGRGPPPPPPQRTASGTFKREREA